jgi:hypothetical protein
MLLPVLSDFAINHLGIASLILIAGQVQTRVILGVSCRLLIAFGDFKTQES